MVPINLTSQIDRVSNFMGRKPDMIISNSYEEYPIVTLRYPGVSDGVPWNDRSFYTTVGLATAQKSSGISERPVELSAFAHAEYASHPEGQFIAAIMNWLAQESIKSHFMIEQGDTYDWGNPFINDCEMSGLYFGSLYHEESGDEIAEEYHENVIEANVSAHLVPISSSELRLSEENGIESLLEVFCQHDLSPYFNFFRKSYI